MENPCGCGNPMQGAKQYVKKPVVVLAKQMDRDFIIQTANGLVKGKVGDYMVKAPSGDTWPVQKEIFETTYEEVTSNKPDEVSPKLAPEGV